MATIQIPSKNSAFKAFKAFKNSPVVGTMVMERDLQGNIQNLSEGMNRYPIIERKRLSEGEDQRVLEGVTHKLKTMADEVMRPCEGEDESILQGNALKIESSDAKRISEKMNGNTDFHEKCEMIKAESGFSRANLQGSFKLPSWNCPSKRTRVKLVKISTEDKNRKVCVFESKKRDSSDCLKIEGGERGKETVEKARHLEKENKKKQAITMASKDDNNNTATKAALSIRHVMRFSYRHLENEKNKKYMNIPKSSTTISSNIVAPRRIEFLFEKTLFQSDVNSLNRLLIPRRFAEAYLPRLKIAKGKYRKENLLLFDHQNIAWEMKFEFWDSSQSYVFTRGWRAFVNHYELRPDFLIRFYKLDQSLNKKHYGIEYVIQLPLPMRTIRLFGQDYPYLRLDAIDGGGFCGNDSGSGGSGSSSDRNITVVGQGKVEGAAMKEDTGL